jgi:hypothetical protein
MEPTLGYLINKHATLKDDYRSADSRYRECCGAIAVEVAQRLVSEAKTPVIMAFYKEMIKNGNKYRESIRPWYITEE